jgi:Concanavalin A-like lectin/glucanases superfamily
VVWEPASFLNLPGYEVVYHLQQTNFPYIDSTLNYPALDGVAPSVEPGIVGNGALFNGSSDFLDASNVDLGNEFTESAWVNLSPSEYNIQALWCNGPGGYSTAEAVLFINDYYPQSGVTDPADGALLFGDDDTQPETATGLVTSNQWHLVTAAINRSVGSIQFYVDGTPEREAGGGALKTDFPTNADMNLGRFTPNTANPNGSSYFNGTMDEARIHGGIDDSNWVWADYMTVAANSTFTTYSTVSNTIVLPITLTIRTVGDQVILNWPEGTLQSASKVTGPYSNVSGATPPYTNTVSGSQQFYRVQTQF